jgi:hypothetical protein
MKELYESVRDLMVGKSKEDVINSIKLNSRHVDPQTIFKEGIKQNSLDGVKYAVEELGADISVVYEDEDMYEMDPLELALNNSFYYNDNSIVKYLISKGLNIRKTIKNVNKKIQEDNILYRDVDYNKKFLDYAKSFDNSIINKFKKIIINESVRDLMVGKSLGDIKNSLGDMSYPDVMKLFLKAISKGELDVVKTLVDSGIGIHGNDEEALREAIRFDQTKIVEYLIQKGARINNKRVLDFIKIYSSTKSSKIIKNLLTTNESHIMRFDDIQNLEFRKGSLEHGDKVKQLIEFLRIYKDQNEDTMVFNKDDFEKASRMKIEDIEKLKNLPSKKSLMEFDIEITDTQIKFTNLQNRKSLHVESFNPDIRKNYEIMGVEDFYNKIGGEYKNPHIDDIEKCIKKCIGLGFDEFDKTLDLASGTGEITTILNELGYNNIDIIGCDPYLYREYTQKTKNTCLNYSFEDIQKGSLSGYEFDTIICSYGLHLADDSILAELFWNLSLISKILIIISPNNRPEVKKDYGWELDKYFKEGKSKCRIYISKNKK